MNNKKLVSPRLMHLMLHEKYRLRLVSTTAINYIIAWEEDQREKIINLSKDIRSRRYLNEKT